MTHERITQAVAELGPGVAAEALIVGSNVPALLIPGFREPRDTDFAVPEGAFRYLRNQGWEESAAYDGSQLLVRGDVEVGMGWGGTSYEDLRSRSWTTDEGLPAAGLPDVYAYKDRRGSGIDVSDMERIRFFLHNPSRPPFSADEIPHEVAAARDCLSEALQAHPMASAAILLAANGMHTVYTLYGHPEIGQANQIIGSLELAEFGVPATYHNGFKLVRDARRVQQHLELAGASALDRLLGLAIDPNTDAVYGNGRVADNPKGYDELRSARLVRAQALQLGFRRRIARRMRNVTIGTTFDEQSRSQRGTNSPDPLTRGVTGVDLQILAEPDWAEATVDLTVENGFSARFSPDRVLGKVFLERGHRVHSTLGALALIDRYAHERPSDSPNGPTVIEFVASQMVGNAAFQRRHKFPSGWTLDHPEMRRDHAITVESVAASLLRGKSMMEAYYADILPHTAAMTALYGND